MGAKSEVGDTKKEAGSCYSYLEIQEVEGIKDI